MSPATHFSLPQYELMLEAGVFDGQHFQRVELIRGEIQEMNPIGVPHAMMVNELNDWSNREAPSDAVWVSIQNPIRLPSSQSAPQPDIAWIVRKDYPDGHPLPEDVLLLIEVSDSTLDADCGEKARLYAEAGIADYWVVALEQREIRVFRQPTAGGYQSNSVVRGDEELRPLAFGEVVLKSSQIFAVDPS
jgi:Uma2 family endonuclease